MMKKIFLHISVCLLLLVGFVTIVPKESLAHCPSCCCAPCGGSCVASQHKQTRKVIVEEHVKTRKHITEEFKAHQIWLLDDFFKGYILPSMMTMTEQLTTVAMQQMMIVGSFFDAKTQLETQKLLQSKTADAHKDYQPSTGMCEISTMTRDLFTAERNSDFNVFLLTQRSQDRQLGLQYASGGLDRKGDRDSRVKQFRKRYCNAQDNNAGFAGVCLASIDPKFINRDIDYTRLVNYPHTLNLDFSDNVVTDDEQDLMALNSNLFGHEIFNRNNLRTPQALRDKKDEYLDIRSTIAKRSVAENSFYTVASLKAAGNVKDSKTSDYLEVALKRLGIEDKKEINAMIGERPSYYAMMDILSQKIYQDPTFFTNLYDKPANVARKDVSMQAIGLMMGRNLYKSELRSEAILSVLLEMELQNLHDKTENMIQGLEETVVGVERGDRLKK